MEPLKKLQNHWLNNRVRVFASSAVNRLAFTTDNVISAVDTSSSFSLGEKLELGAVVTPNEGPIDTSASSLKETGGFEGAVVGCILGFVEGEADGDVVGKRVGPTDGVSEGYRVANNVGTVVGSRLG